MCVAWQAPNSTKITFTVLVFAKVVIKCVNSLQSKGKKFWYPFKIFTKSVYFSDNPPHNILRLF